MSDLKELEYYMQSIQTRHYRTSRASGVVIVIGTLLVCCSTVMISGCESHVVSRSGIGSDRVNPDVQERQKSDPLTDWVFGEEESKRR